ncbi:4-hydroxybenzoate octaprenyltransferase [Halothiobacillus sp. DCM-1]|uniref:4-hydroxybenzoate octaprenyltransferase n=1 Tax=Halothiobacillus sp. DCM-1 TaxID=3112558 RepID=UPI0032534448
MLTGLQTVWRHLPHYWVLTRMNRPIGIYLLMWPTWWALWLAGRGQTPDWRLWLIFTAGVVVMRAAGCAINDYADRQVDAHVARTRHRPLAAGLISPREALGVFVVLCLIALLLVLQLNTATILLSLVAVVLAASYPFGKRIHHLPQLHLGLAFGWSIPMAFAAQTGSVPTVGWILLAANVAWTIAYDTLYAMADREDDLKIGVKSTAILFGRWDLPIISALYGLALGLLAWIGLRQGLGVGYFVGLSLAACSAAWLVYGARSRGAAESFQAFLRNNLFGALVMLGFLLG